MSPLFSFILQIQFYEQATRHTQRIVVDVVVGVSVAGGDCVMGSRSPCRRCIDWGGAPMPRPPGHGEGRPLGLPPGAPTRSLTTTIRRLIRSFLSNVCFATRRSCTQVCAYVYFCVLLGQQLEIRMVTLLIRYLKYLRLKLHKSIEASI